MNHRIYCVHSLARSTFVYDSNWFSMKEAGNHFTDLPRILGSVPKFEFPVWFFWLYQNEASREEIPEKLDSALGMIYKALKDSADRQGTALDYLPKKKLPKPESRCFTLLFYTK
jgi:hypothetical protein